MSDQEQSKATISLGSRKNSSPLGTLYEKEDRTIPPQYKNIISSRKKKGFDKIGQEGLVRAGRLDTYDVVRRHPRKLLYWRGKFSRKNTRRD